MLEPYVLKETCTVLRGKEAERFPTYPTTTAGAEFYTK